MIGPLFGEAGDGFTGANFCVLDESVVRNGGKGHARPGPKGTWISQELGPGDFVDQGLCALMSEITGAARLHRVASGGRSGWASDGHE